MMTSLSLICIFLREIGVNMPAEVETFLSRDNITKSDIQKIDSAVVRADPNSSVYK